MKHYFHPGFISGQIRCAHCGDYFKEFTKRSLFECAERNPFAKVLMTKADNCRYSRHKAQWDEFVLKYPQHAIDDESYHAPAKSRVLVIPASIVPSLQCYKEYNHKRKELRHKDWPDFELEEFPRLVRTASSCYIHNAMQIPATLHEVEFHERVMPYRTQGGLVTGHNY